MHAFLIIGQTAEKRKEKIRAMLNEEHISPFDERRLILTEEAVSLGIAAVRNWQKQLLLMPQSSPYTAGIIESAELLTIESQNAILKTLEEPPIHTQLYLEAPSEQSVLPTILSRCHIVSIELPTHEDITKDEQQCLSLVELAIHPTTTVGMILHAVDEQIKTKSAALQWIDLTLHAINKTKKQWQHIYGPLNKNLLLARKQLIANVSYKLVLDHLFLSLMTRQS